MLQLINPNTNAVVCTINDEEQVQAIITLFKDLERKPEQRQLLPHLQVLKAWLKEAEAFDVEPQQRAFKIASNSADANDVESECDTDSDEDESSVTLPQDANREMTRAFCMHLRCAIWDNFGGADFFKEHGLGEFPTKADVKVLFNPDEFVFVQHLCANVTVECKLPDLSPGMVREVVRKNVDQVIKDNGSFSGYLMPALVGLVQEAARMRIETNLYKGFYLHGCLHLPDEGRAVDGNEFVVALERPYVFLSQILNKCDEAQTLQFLQFDKVQKILRLTLNDQVLRKLGYFSGVWLLLQDNPFVVKYFIEQGWLDDKYNRDLSLGKLEERRDRLHHVVGTHFSDRNHHCVSKDLKEIAQWYELHFPGVFALLMPIVDDKSADDDPYRQQIKFFVENECWKCLQKCFAPPQLPTENELSILIEESVIKVLPDDLLSKINVHYSTFCQKANPKGNTSGEKLQEALLLVPYIIKIRRELNRRKAASTEASTSTAAMTSSFEEPEDIKELTCYAEKVRERLAQLHPGDERYQKEVFPSELLPNELPILVQDLGKGPITASDARLTDVDIGPAAGPQQIGANGLPANCC